MSYRAAKFWRGKDTMRRGECTSKDNIALRVFREEDIVWHILGVSMDMLAEKSDGSGLHAAMCAAFASGRFGMQQLSAVFMLASTCTCLRSKRKTMMRCLSLAAEFSFTSTMRAVLVIAPLCAARDAIVDKVFTDAGLIHAIAPGVSSCISGDIFALADLAQDNIEEDWSFERVAVKRKLQDMVRDIEMYAPVQRNLQYTMLGTWVLLKFYDAKWKYQAVHLDSISGELHAWKLRVLVNDVEESRVIPTILAVLGLYKHVSTDVLVARNLLRLCNQCMFIVQLLVAMEAIMREKEADYSVYAGGPGVSAHSFLCTDAIRRLCPTGLLHSVLDVMLAHSGDSIVQDEGYTFKCFYWHFCLEQKMQVPEAMPLFEDVV